jgi:hypothetical protein
LFGEKALQADVLVQVGPMDALAASNEAVVTALGHRRELQTGVEPERDQQHLSVCQVDAHEVCPEGDAADSQDKASLR